MSGRLRDERGMTLVELLVACMVGTLVIVASFSLLDTAGQSGRDTADRVEAVARGRLAMEDMSRQIRSQLCVGTTPPIVEGTATKLVFTGSLTTEPTASGHVMQKRTLEYVPTPVGATKGNIIETVVPGTGSPPVFNGAGQTRRIVEGVAPVNNKVFRYHTFDTANLPNTRELTALPLSVADRRIVSHIQIAFDSMPIEQGRNPRLKTLFDTTVYVRSSDPTAPSPGPRCT